MAQTRSIDVYKDNCFQEDNEKYRKKLDEVKVLQKKCLSGIAHQRYRMKKINEALK